MPTPKKNPPKKPTRTEEDDPETPDGSEGSGDPAGEDGEDREAAAEENRRLNAIVTSRVKREMKPLLQTLSQLQESINKLTPASKPDDEDDPDEQPTEEQPAKGKKKVELDPAVNRKLTKLERELADEKAARKRAEEEKTAELERGKKAEMRSAFSAVLTEHGVTDPRLLRSALTILDEDGIMVRDEDGKIKFKGQDKYGIETLYDPKVGLKQWLAGDGKSFIPAVDAGGSGTGGARGVGNSNLTQNDIKKMNPQQLASINLERACSGLPPLGEDNH